MDTKTKLLHIFKPGKHVTAAGETIEFSAADLEATARAYNPALHKAPLVIGHPKTDDPAQGWAKSLVTQARGLYAEPFRVDAEFAEAVNTGRWGTISSKFYRPDDLNNPVPGIWYLRHIGFLGAQAPGVKGMDEPEFAEDEGVCFQEGVEFSGWSEVQNASLWRRMREWIIGKHGLDEADKVIPDYAVATLEDEARREQEEPKAPAFSEVKPTQETQTVTPEEAAALEASNAQLKQQLADAQAQAAKARHAQTHADNVAFAESLTGKLKPDQRSVVLATLDHLGTQAAPVEFGEGDAKKPLADALKEVLKDLPDLVEFNEVATKEKAAGGTGLAKEVEFSAPSGYSVDTERLALHQKALAHAEKNAVSYDQALAVVSR